MAQFHVYCVPGDRLVLDLQTDLIETGIRVVAPLGDVPVNVELCMKGGVAFPEL